MTPGFKSLGYSKSGTLATSPRRGAGSRWPPCAGWPAGKRCASAPPASARPPGAPPPESREVQGGGGGGGWGGVGCGGGVGVGWGGGGGVGGVWGVGVVVGCGGGGGGWGVGCGVWGGGSLELFSLHTSQQSASLQLVAWIGLNPWFLYWEASPKPPNHQSKLPIRAHSHFKLKTKDVRFRRGKT